MEPNEALGIAAQVAVTLAGFAGVVVIFRPDSIHQWSRVDRFRLQLLLHNSICPLAYSLIGMLLLTVKPTPEWIWRGCSAFALLFQLPGSLSAFKNSRKLTAADYQGTSMSLFYGISAIGALTLVLQVLNIATLNWFWPFFAAIVMHLMAGMLQFTRMVLMSQKE